MPPVGPGSSVQRSSLREQIADALRDEMLTGRLPGGRRFTVKEIAELYEVSATPVREALVDLAAQGLLEVEHHRGFKVRQFTLADFEALVEARVLILDGVYKSFMRRGLESMARSHDALASARRRGEAAVRAVLAGHLDVLIGCDLRYWRELAGLIGNEHVLEFFTRLRVQSWMFCVPYLREEPDLSTVCWREHVALVDAIAAGQLDQVRKIIGEFNEQSVTVMRRLTRSCPKALPKIAAGDGEGGDADDGGGAGARAGTPR